MSEMEYNKGKLVLVSSDVETYAGQAIKNLDERFYDSKEEEFLDQCMEKENFVVIDGKVYAVDWEYRKGDLDEFARASTNSDGTIDFETYHYNGGAHWTEVVEVALKKSMGRLNNED